MPRPHPSRQRDILYTFPAGTRLMGRGLAHPHTTSFPRTTFYTRTHTHTHTTSHPRTTFYTHTHTHTLSQVKKDIDTGKSRGFGFVRYFDEDIQKKVQGMKHTVKGRKVDVKFPKKVNLHSFKADFSATLKLAFPETLDRKF